MNDPALAIAFFVGLGAISGLLSGMLGIGGGVVVVPALIIGLPLLGVESPELTKLAMATSLATVIPTTLASAQSHAAKDGIDWHYLLLLLPSFVAGAFVTATFIGGFNTSFIILVFILFTLYSAFRLWRGWRGRQQQQTTPRLVPMTVRGILGGALSSLLGIGAAVVAVPYLERFISLPRAIGTAAALGLPMAVAGTIAFLMAPSSCPGCFGYVYPPAVAAIGIAAVLAAPLGVWVAHAVPVRVLRRTFAVFLFVAAGSLAYKAFTPEVIAAESARVIALGKRLMTPVRPAVVPAWIGNEPAPAPWLALIQQYGPHRSFSPVVKRADEPAAPFIMPHVVQRFVMQTEATASAPKTTKSRLAKREPPRKAAVIDPTH